MQGILMKPDMIAATVDGRKTQTRRVVKPQPILETMPSSSGTIANTLGYFWKGHYIGNIENLTDYARYHAGETVYIKEAWAVNTFHHFILIEAVRAERVQEITYEGILAEGWDVKTSQPVTNRTAGEDARDWFLELWNSINPKYPWDSNAFCWVYQFRLES